MVEEAEVEEEEEDRDTEEEGVEEAEVEEEEEVYFWFIFAYSFFNCLNTFCKTWLIVSKLNTHANKTTLRNIPFTSTVGQIETVLLKPNNPLSKCHSDDKMIHTCII